MVQGAAQRKFDEIHADAPFHDGTFTLWADTSSDETPYHYKDGTGIWLSREDLTPDDQFLTPVHLRRDD